MKRSHVCVTGFAALALGILVGCSNDDGNSTDSNPTTASGAAVEGVDCTHPGAGAKREDGLCACTVKRDASGDWAGKRTCAEGSGCPARDLAEDFAVTQTGNQVTAESSRSKLTGTMCGDYIVFTGGPKDGSNPECGVIRFSDDNRFVRDSCYAAPGTECKRSYSSGCKDQKGWCTATGARKPDAAPAITKTVCL